MFVNERYTSRQLRDARARELAAQGLTVTRRTSKNQSLDPRYVEDIGGLSSKRDSVSSTPVVGRLLDTTTQPVSRQANPARTVLLAPAPTSPPQATNQGTVYTLHFDRPFGHARHYTGWSKDLDKRLWHHKRGTGANLLKHVAAAGIDWTLARTWSGDRNLERKLKQQGGASRRCPICRTAAT
jgi:predicted GIY-YIG superfamily endonuclease